VVDYAVVHHGKWVVKVTTGRWLVINLNCFGKHSNEPACYIREDNFLMNVKFGGKTRCNNKALLLFHNDAHNHKITGILKQLKIPRSLRHVSVHVGTIFGEPFLCLAKTSYDSISSSFMT
jgi:hypothetical protein